MTDENGCPFCPPPTERVILEHPLAIAIRDGFPVSPGHSLIVPKRHVASWFEATGEEQAAMMALLEQVKRLLDKKFQPAGYNIGINDGPAAGQTVPHLHLHLIPRYPGDVADPRGGVRWVIPGDARYWDE